MLFILNLPLSWSQEDDLMQDGITKPALSLRCKELFKERNEKIKVQQRLNSLKQRNEDLIKKSPENKKTLNARLKLTQIKVNNELLEATQQIESMEENIVRSGCPGLTL